jgi:putative ABC transport system substrate-binding protein
VLAIKAGITNIPIVFTTSSDPVQIGLVASLARPGGNVTGATILSVELARKQLEMARELLPAASSIDALVNPTTPETEVTLREYDAAARALGLDLHVLHASTVGDLNTVFATLGQRRSGALVIGPDAFFSSNSQQLAALTAKYAVPAISSLREFPDSGGLMSYGGRLSDAYRLAGIYTGRILKGDKPSDLPVQQATKVELVINLKTAKALGLTVPASVFARADEIIE